MPIKTKSQLKPEVKKLFTGTEVGALLEDVDQKLGTIIEGQQTLERKLDTLTKTQHHLDARVERAEVRLDTLEVR